MAYTPLLVAFAVLLSAVQSHYTFMRLSLNGKWAAPLQYVRNHTHDYLEPNSKYPFDRPRVYDSWTVIPDSPESMRCGRDNMAWAEQTEMLNVRAGDDELEFSQIGGEPGNWLDEMFNDCPNGRGTCREAGYTNAWFHPGPVVVHISRVPDGEDIHTYDGSGEWVKIHTYGFEFHEGAEPQGVNWLAQNATFFGGNANAVPGRIIFRLPKETPKGQYLLRAAQIWPTWDGPNGRGDTQLYHSCAHIQVSSEATGSLPKGVLIPEVFQYGEKGMTVSEEMYLGDKVDADYEHAGGPLWTGKELVADKPSL